MKLNLKIAAIAFVVAARVTSAVDVPATAATTQPTDYHAAAAEVTAHIQEAYYLPNVGLYATSLTDRSPEFMWGNGIMFSALVAATRHEPRTYGPVMARFFTEMDQYWDRKANVPGYEPSRTKGNGHDKYYDDNAWMVLTFVEAYELTGERRYLARADEALTFVLSGWDDVQGGGIWWHEGHKEESKNTCSNAPAAVACLRIAGHLPEKSKLSIEMARRIVDWTTKTFQNPDGLFADSINTKTQQMNDARLTYNTALMIRAWLGLYRATGEERYLAEAKRVGAASDWFVDQKTGAYRDSVKWAHLLVEADLELYRATGDRHLLKRATENADEQYRMWKQSPPDTLIDSASIARMLWLMADLQSESGRDFWRKSDAAGSLKR